MIVYTPRPTATGESADAVLGQTVIDAYIDPGAGQGFTPRGLGVFGARLYLSDSNVASGQSRVLVYHLANLP